MASYPTSVAGYGSSDFNTFASLCVSTLGATINAGDMTITVASASTNTIWPLGNFAINVEAELIFIASRSGTTLTVGSRGYDGTSAAAHGSGVTVEVVQTARHITKLVDEVRALETEVGVTGAQNFIRHSNVSATEGFLRKTAADTYIAIKSNLSAVVAPTVNEDSGDGYGIGSIWIDTAADKIYIATDVTVGAAVWKDLTASTGAPANAQYIVANLSGDLTDERNLVAGSGLTSTDGGAGAAFTLNVGAGTGITVAADSVAVDQAFSPSWTGTHAFTGAGALLVPLSATPAQTAEGSIVWDSDGDFLTVGTGSTRKSLVNNDRTITAGNGLTGGGDLSADVVLNVAVAAGSNLVANANDLDWTGVDIQEAGSLAGTRRIVNFIEGSGISLVVDDNPGSTRVDVTIASLAGGVGGSGEANQVAYWSATSTLAGNSQFVFNGSKIELLTQGTGGGVLFGTDAHLYRGATDRLDLASGDSLNIVNGSILTGSAANLAERLNIVGTQASGGAGSATARALIVRQDAGTYTFTGDQTGDIYGWYIGQVTVADGTASGTITNAASLYVAGQPLAGSNVSITNRYAVWAPSGTSKFAGIEVTTLTVDSGNFEVTSGSSKFPRASGASSTPTIYASSSNGGTLALGASLMSAGFERFRIAGPASGGGSGAVGSSSQRGVVAVQDAGTYTFTTNPQTGNVYAWDLKQVTIANPSAGAIGNAATLYIAGAPIAGTNATITNPYAIWANSGTVRVDSTILSQNINSGGTILGNGTVSAYNVGTDSSSRVSLHGSPLLPSILVQNPGVTMEKEGSAAATALHFHINEGAFNFTTAQTGAVYQQRINALTLNGTSSQTIPDAAALYIAAAPAAGSNTAITNPYAILVDGGNVRFDGNVLVEDSAAVGTSGAGVIAIAIGVEPSTSPADNINIYAKNSSDGSANATLALRTEQAVETVGTFTASDKLRIWINGVEYWIQLDAV